MNMADPIKRISDSRTQQYWTSISSTISNTTNKLRVNIFNPPLPSTVVERTIEVKYRFTDVGFFFLINIYIFSIFLMNDQHWNDNDQLLMNL